MEAMIKLENINKRFKDNHVLKGINLTIEEGQTVSLLGSSGSGKSTLLRCINLLETPDEGRISIGDFSFDASAITKHVKTEARKRTAMVFQNFGLFANKTALENVTEALIVVRKIKKKEAEDIGRHYLDKVGLLQQADQYPVTLSGGQKQRVAISRALALEPKILLFDEPTSALDPELVTEVLKVIRKVAEENVTMLIVTHEMDFAKDVSDRVAFMADGQILEEGSGSEFFLNPKTERARRFLDRYLQRFSYSI